MHLNGKFDVVKTDICHSLTLLVSLRKCSLSTTIVFIAVAGIIIVDVVLRIFCEKLCDNLDGYCI